MTTEPASVRTISVAICTRNRERLLAGALESLCHVRPPEQMAWQVVIILNDCTDRSSEVVDQFRSRLPIVSDVEPRPGLSRARNRAIDIATGEAIIWIDDDVSVVPDWLCSYESAFLRWPQASVFGGPILPEFEGDPPLWLTQSWQLCGSAFAARRVPQPDAPIRPDDNYPPYGANFAVRMPAQRLHRYDVRLGAQSGRFIMTGEETQVIGAIFRDGGSGRWVHSAVVRHVMPKERQTIAYIRAYYESCGWLSERTSAPVGVRPNPVQRHLDRSSVLTSELRFQCLRVLAPPTRWMPALVGAATARGRWLGRYRADCAGST
jgi:glucosyl-dolichyl phosphate glucuronosyltransferase